MAYTQNEAIEVVKAFLKETSKRHSVYSAYLFGSYAKGDQKGYSDIDVAVIVDKCLQSRRYYNEAFEIFHEAQEYNSLLEILCFREDEFEGNSLEIITRIKKEGIKIEFS